MRRDGRTGYEQNQGSSWLSSLGWIAGGLGVGAGLLYFLDPDKGSKRRQHAMKQAQGWGRSLSDTASSTASSASEYASSAYDTARSLVGSLMGRAGKSSSQTFADVSNWSKGQLEELGDQIHEMLGGQTHTQRMIGVSVCALSSMALGAALMYIFDPQLGERRRQQMKESLSNYSEQAGQTISDYSQRAGQAIRSGAQQVKEKASSAMSQVGQATGISGGTKGQDESQSDL